MGLSRPGSRTTTIPRRSGDTVGRTGSLQKLTVEVISARNLRNRDAGWLVGSAKDCLDPYCIVSIPGKDKSTQTQIRTAVQRDTLNPVWNHKEIKENWEPSDSVTFTVYDKDFLKQDDVLGRATILASQFAEEGFKGDLKLQDARVPNAFITVSIYMGVVTEWQDDLLVQAAAASDGVYAQTEVTAVKTRRTSMRAGLDCDSKGITRQQFRDFLISERSRNLYCSTFLLTFLLTIVFALVAWSFGCVGSVNRLQATLYRAFNEVQVDRMLPDGTKLKALTLDSLSDVSDLWDWMGSGLVPLLGGDPARPGYVRSFNKVLGKLELVQSRALVKGCGEVGHVSAALADYYRLGCRSDSPTKEQYGLVPVANATKDPAFVPGSRLTGTPVLSKEAFYAFVDATPVAVGSVRVAELRAGNWIDDATEWVEARVALFNGEVSIFSDVTMHFSFQDGGLVSKTLRISPVPIPQWSIGDIIIAVLFLLLLLALMLGIIQEVLDRKAKRAKAAAAASDRDDDEDDEGGCLSSCCGPCARCGSLFFGDIWLSIDWLGFILGIGMIVIFLLVGPMIAHMGGELQKLAQVDSDSLNARPAWNATATKFERYDEGQANYQTALALVMEELRLATVFKTAHRITMFCFCFFLLLRFLRGSLGQPYIAEIIRTVHKALPDLVHLSLILAITFENFVLSGCLFFGSGLKEWSTINDSHRAALALLSGTGDWNAMYEEYPAAALLWLFCFAVVIVFISANMLLAIMVDHFREVREEYSQVRQTLVTQAFLLVDDAWWKGSFNGRRFLRLLQRRYAWTTKVTPYLDPELPRVKVIPWDEMIAFFTPAPNDPGDNSTAPWAPLDMGDVLSLGLDKATSLRLVQKCESVVGGRRPNEFPADMVYFEFNDKMKAVYHTMSGTDDDLRIWLSERRVDCEELEPRQRKFEALALSDIQPRPREDEQMLMPQPLAQGSAQLMLSGPPVARQPLSPTNMMIMQ